MKYPALKKTSEKNCEQLYILQTRKNILKSNNLNFFVLLHKYMLFYTGNQNFKDFMPSVFPDLLMDIRKKAMVAIFVVATSYLFVYKHGKYLS